MSRIFASAFVGGSGGASQPAVDPYLLALRTALSTMFKTHPAITSTDPDAIADNAGIMPLYTAVVTAFQTHASKAVIRSMIEQVLVDDDSELSSLKAQLLSVPEWETDTSDAS